MRYSPGFQRLLEYAAYDCAQRGQSEVVADHLLMGLFREDFPLIDEVLAAFRVDSLVVLDRLLRRHPQGGPPTSPDRVALAPSVLQVIAHAEKEAGDHGHDFVAPSHTLLGLLAVHRQDLSPFFIREAVYRRREDEVIGAVRQLVRWLRFEAEAGVTRELDVIDHDTLVGLEAVRLKDASQKSFAVRLELLKRFST